LAPRAIALADTTIRMSELADKDGSTVHAAAAATVGEDVFRYHALVDQYGASIMRAVRAILEKKFSVLIRSGAQTPSVAHITSEVSLDTALLNSLLLEVAGRRLLLVVRDRGASTAFLEGCWPHIYEDWPATLSILPPPDLVVGTSFGKVFAAAVSGLPNADIPGISDYSDWLLRQYTLFENDGIIPNIVKTIPNPSKEGGNLSKYELHILKLANQLGISGDLQFKRAVQAAAEAALARARAAPIPSDGTATTSRVGPAEGDSGPIGGDAPSPGPATATEVYAERADRTETPLAFLERVWGAQIRGGSVQQADLRRLDEKLVAAIYSYCQRKRLRASDYLPSPRRAELASLTAEELLVRIRTQKREATARSRANAKRLQS